MNIFNVKNSILFVSLHLLSTLFNPELSRPVVMKDL